MTPPPRIDARSASRRLPPGQVETRKWPVLHAGRVPDVDLARWRFSVSGLVDHPLSLSWDELSSLPRQETLCDIHCVTRWSRFDNVFGGVPVRALLAAAGVQADARFALVHAEHGFTTNLPLADLDRDANLVALTWGGEPLTPEHGGPARLLVPHLYFWKSAKWVTGIELLREDRAGFWEEGGYHMRGDPWDEERFRRPDPVRMRRGERA
ncbi:MAG TPA: sulfite oxidase-like oxidoreductase [Gemmatimonadales bacterium]